MRSVVCLVPHEVFEFFDDVGKEIIKYDSSESLSKDNYMIIQILTIKIASLIESTVKILRETAFFNGKENNNLREYIRKKHKKTPISPLLSILRDNLDEVVSGTELKSQSYIEEFFIYFTAVTDTFNSLNTVRNDFAHEPGFSSTITGVDLKKYYDLALLSIHLFTVKSGYLDEKIQITTLNSYEEGFLNGINHKTLKKVIYCRRKPSSIKDDGNNIYVYITQNNFNFSEDELKYLLRNIRIKHKDSTRTLKIKDLYNSSTNKFKFFNSVERTEEEVLNFCLNNLDLLKTPLIIDFSNKMLV